MSFVDVAAVASNRFRLATDHTDAGAGAWQRYFRATRQEREAIPETNRCAFCHSGPKYTNQKMFRRRHRQIDRPLALVDTPQLINVALTAPYLHDGSARTLEEIWTVFNPHDKHGVTNDLTKDELNDLIEYLRTYENTHLRYLAFVPRSPRHAAPPEMPRFRWENFTTANGLPDNHVFCVLVDGDRIWAATENGLGLYEAASGNIHTAMDWRIAQCFMALDKRQAMCGPPQWAV